MSIWKLLIFRNSPFVGKLVWRGHILLHRFQLLVHYFDLQAHLCYLFWDRWWLFIILRDWHHEAIFISHLFLLHVFSFLLILFIHALLLPFFLLLLLLFILQIFCLTLLRFFLIFHFFHVAFLVLFVFWARWFYLLSLPQSDDLVTETLNFKKMKILLIS